MNLGSDLFGSCHKHENDCDDQQAGSHKISAFEGAPGSHEGDQENTEALDDLKRYGYHRPCIFEVLRSEYVGDHGNRDI